MQQTLIKQITNRSPVCQFEVAIPRSLCMSIVLCALFSFSTIVENYVVIDLFVKSQATSLQTRVEALAIVTFATYFR